MKYKKEVFCDYCLSCMNDCRRYTCNTPCENYVKAIPIDELNEIIRYQNVNLRRFCKDNNLKLYILQDMLKGKIPPIYKYLKLLSDRLMEKEEYLPYLEEVGKN